MANTAELTKSMKALFLELFPDLNGYHFPIKAKVVAVHEDGGRVNEFNKCYSIDVQPLKPDGSIDETQPVIPDVELPVIWAGPQRGVFALPVKGATVRLGYYYNDPSYPFIDAILADGFHIPDHAVDSLIIQHSEGIRMEFTPDRKIVFVEGNHPLAFADVLKAIYDGHTHTCPDGTTSPPHQKMDGHDSKKVFTG